MLVQLAQGPLGPLLVLLVVDEEVLLDEVLLGSTSPQASIAAHELAFTMHFFAASEKLAQAPSQLGGVAPQVVAIAAHTSAQDVELVLPPAPELPELEVLEVLESLELQASTPNKQKPAMNGSVIRVRMGRRPSTGWSPHKSI